MVRHLRRFWIKKDREQRWLCDGNNLLTKFAWSPIRAKLTLVLKFIN